MEKSKIIGNSIAFRFLSIFHQIVANMLQFETIFNKNKKNQWVFISGLSIFQPIEGWYPWLSKIIDDHRFIGWIGWLFLMKSKNSIIFWPANINTCVFRIFIIFSYFWPILPMSSHCSTKNTHFCHFVQIVYICLKSTQNEAFMEIYSQLLSHQNKPICKP